MKKFALGITIIISTLFFGFLTVNYITMTKLAKYAEKYYEQHQDQGSQTVATVFGLSGFKTVITKNIGTNIPVGDVFADVVISQGLDLKSFYMDAQFKSENTPSELIPKEVNLKAVFKITSYKTVFDIIFDHKNIDFNEITDKLLDPTISSKDKLISMSSVKADIDQYSVSGSMFGEIFDKTELKGIEFLLQSSSSDSDFDAYDFQLKIDDNLIDADWGQLRMGGFKVNSNALDLQHKQSPKFGIDFKNIEYVHQGEKAFSGSLNSNFSGESFPEYMNLKAKWAFRAYEPIVKLVSEMDESNFDSDPNKGLKLKKSIQSLLKSLVEFGQINSESFFDVKTNEMKRFSEANQIDYDKASFKVSGTTIDKYVDFSQQAVTKIAIGGDNNAFNLHLSRQYRPTANNSKNDLEILQKFLVVSSNFIKGKQSVLHALGYDLGFEKHGAEFYLDHANNYPVHLINLLLSSGFDQIAAHRANFDLKIDYQLKDILKYLSTKAYFDIYKKGLLLLDFSSSIPQTKDYAAGKFNMQIKLTGDNLDMLSVESDGSINLKSIALSVIGQCNNDWCEEPNQLFSAIAASPMSNQFQVVPMTDALIELALSNPNQLTITKTKEGYIISGHKLDKYLSIISGFTKEQPTKLPAVDSNSKPHYLEHNQSKRQQLKMKS